jgi:hypothetical protein
MTYYQLMKKIQEMTFAQQQHQVAIVDRTYCHFLWAGDVLIERKDFHLPPDQTDGVEETQIAILT